MFRVGSAFRANLARLAAPAAAEPAVARLRKENKPVKPAPEPKQSAPAEPVKPAPNAERLRREVQSRANARRNGPERMEDGRLKPPDLG